MRVRTSLLVLAVAACSTRLPEPRYTAQPTSALVEVDYPPPPARVEIVPERPHGDAIWVRGSWMWEGRRWGWKPGAWVVAPREAAYARPTLVRRDDGRLFFAAGAFRDANGREVSAPEPEKVARTRSGDVVTPEDELAPIGPDVLPDAGSADAAPE